MLEACSMGLKLYSRHIASRIFLAILVHVRVYILSWLDGVGVLHSVVFSGLNRCSVPQLCIPLSNQDWVFPSLPRSGIHQLQWCSLKHPSLSCDFGHILVCGNRAQLEPANLYITSQSQKWNLLWVAISLSCPLNSPEPLVVFFFHNASCKILLLMCHFGLTYSTTWMLSRCTTVVKNSPANVGDGGSVILGLIPG